jgi:hypothetical protein
MLAVASLETSLSLPCRAGIEERGRCSDALLIWVGGGRMGRVEGVLDAL